MSLNVRADGMFLFDEADFEEIECLMPNGVLLAGVKVHPGDSIFHIKEAVLEKATTGKKKFDGITVSAHSFTESGEIIRS